MGANIKSYCFAGCLIVFLLFSLSANAQKNWHFSFTPGLSAALPAPLRIKQNGFPDISHWASYKTEPLILPVYYSFHFGFMKKGKGWETEMNHLKIILDNTTDDIQQFSISHGYNQLFVNRAFMKNKIGIKLGAGVVLAHPENIIRDKQLKEKNGMFGSGYYFSGPAIQAGIYKEFFLTNRFFLLAASKISLAYSNVPVAGGRAHAPVMALHLQLGPGYCFIKKEHLN